MVVLVLGGFMLAINTLSPIERSIFSLKPSYVSGRPLLVRDRKPSW